MPGETLYTRTDYFHPFPKPAEVFARDVEQHAAHLLPLASVDLSHLSRDWRGRLHFIAPIEPAEGLVGEEAGQYHTYLCRKNWVGYHIRDGKYELATDFRFFRQTRLGLPTIAAAPAATDDDLAIHYGKIQEGFALQKAHFQQHRCLHNPWAKTGLFGGYRKADRTALVTELGGESGDGNWANLEDFPLRSPGEWQDDDGRSWKIVRPVTEDGRLFSYIGLVRVNAYVRPNPSFRGLGVDLLLFYDPVSQVALTTFDYS